MDFALISDGGNSLITASSLISSHSCHKVVAEVGEMHKLFCRIAEESHQRFNKRSTTGDECNAQRGSI